MVPASVVLSITRACCCGLLRIRGSALLELVPILAALGPGSFGLFLGSGRGILSEQLRRGRIHTIIDHSVHQIFLVGDAFGLPPEALLKDVLLRRVERL